MSPENEASALGYCSWNLTQESCLGRALQRGHERGEARRGSKKAAARYRLPILGVLYHRTRPYVVFLFRLLGLYLALHYLR